MISKAELEAKFAMTEEGLLIVKQQIDETLSEQWVPGCALPIYFDPISVETQHKITTEYQAGGWTVGVSCSDENGKFFTRFIFS